MGYWLELRSWLFKDPAKLIRYVVLFVCSIIVIVQLYECFSKLYDPPISTHSYYNLNETIEMPAVTICREPPYKADVLTKLSGQPCPHPKYLTCWNKYPFGEIDLEEFFMNSTFNMEETFFYKKYGLNGLKDNVEVTSSLHFFMGRCYTVRPKVTTKRALRSSGYSIMLKHHVNLSNTETHYETEPGWHIFIHDKKENFTEINMRGSGRVEYLFVELNEEIEIKLQSQYFSNIETRHQLCSSNENYSDLKCGEICIWKDMAELANCTGPWMQDIPQNPCNNVQSMQNLITAYEIVYNSEDNIEYGCIQPCESHIFSTYIQNRKSFIQPQTLSQIWIYYTTKLISMIEERPGYDATQFIADVGGSLGFLLGLSVLGLIGILEHITIFFCGCFSKKLQKQHGKKQKATDGDLEQGDNVEIEEKSNIENAKDIELEKHSEGSDNTIDIATISNNSLYKY